MTNEIIFKTRVDTGTTSKDLAAINTELGKIDESTKSIGTDSAAQLEALNAKIKAGGLSARDLSKSIKEYMTIAIQAGTETPVGKEAIANASQLKDDIRSLGEEISRTKDGAGGMQAVLQLGSTVVAGYSVAQGSMAMLGVESEELMETMVKLQSATSVLTGLEQIRANLEKEQHLTIRAKALQTKILTAATAAYSVAVGTSSGALRVFRLALISTGIGAILVAVGLLIANFDKVTGAVKNVSDWFGNLGEKTKLALSIIFPFIGAIRLITGALEKLGIIDSEEAVQAAQLAKEKQKALSDETAARRKASDDAISENKKMQNSIESHYDFEIAKAKAAGKDTSRLEREKRAEMKKTLEEQIKNLELSLKLNGTNASEMMRIIKEIGEVRKQLLENEQSEQLATISEGTNARKKAADAGVEAEKNRVDAAAKQLERERLLRDYFIKSIADDDVRALVQLQENHKREEEELIKKYGKESDVHKALKNQQKAERLKLEQEWIDAQTKIRTDAEIKEAEEKRRNEMAALELKLIALEKEGKDTYAVRQQILEAEKLQALANTDLTENEKLLIKANYNKKILDADKEAADKEIARAKQVADEKERIQKQLYDSLNNLTETAFIIGDAFGKQDEKSKEKRARAQFKITKAMQLGMAINDGYKAITASLAQSPVAIGPLPNPAGIASLAFAASTAAVNVAKIAASKFQGGGTAGIDQPTPTIPQVGAPDVSQSQQPQAQGTQTAGLTNQTSRVVVVDSEIKAVMDSSQQIEVVSSFGG
jgi:hypothetical protein